MIVHLPGDRQPIRVDGTAGAVTEGRLPGTHGVRVILDKQAVQEEVVGRIRDYVEGITELFLGSGEAARAELFGRKIGVKEIGKIVEELKMSLDNDRKVCAVGDVLTFSFNQLNGQPPLTVGARIREMLAGALMDKYGVSEEVASEALAQCKSKINDIGKRYFMNMVRRKVAGGQ